MKAKIILHDIEATEDGEIWTSCDSKDENDSLVDKIREWFKNIIK